MASVLSIASSVLAAVSANYSIVPETVDSGGGRQSSAAYANIGSVGGIVGTSTTGSVTVFHGYIAQLGGDTVLVLYPPGDVNGSFTVTGADSLLINQVIVGLRSNTHPVFATAGFANGDLNTNNVVNGADSLLINQTLVGLRAYMTTKIVPNARTNIVVTPVTIFGVGFPTNGTVTQVRIGQPVNLTLSNVIVQSREKITAVVPPGGGTGVGVVEVIATSTNGVTSFGKFENK